MGTLRIMIREAFGNRLPDICFCFTFPFCFHLGVTEMDIILLKMDGNGAHQRLDIAPGLKLIHSTQSGNDCQKVTAETGQPIIRARKKLRSLKKL
jgi:hypothetical protein